MEALTLLTCLKTTQRVTENKVSQMAWPGKGETDLSQNNVTPILSILVLLGIVPLFFG